MDTDTGDPEGYSQSVLKEEKARMMKPEREGRKPLTSFREEKAGIHGQKGGKSVLGAQEAHAKMQRHEEEGTLRNCSHELGEVRLHIAAARLRCQGKGVSWHLQKDQSRK